MLKLKNVLPLITMSLKKIKKNRGDMIRPVIMSHLSHRYILHGKIVTSIYTYIFFVLIYGETSYENISEKWKLKVP